MNLKLVFVRYEKSFIENKVILVRLHVLYVKSCTALYLSDIYLYADISPSQILRRSSLHLPQM